MLFCYAVSALAFPLLMPAQGSHLRRVFPNPTGTNGYEEYLRAADLVNDGLASAYSDSVATANATPGAMQLAERLRQMDYLAVREEAAKRYEKAIDLVVQGNGKLSHDPGALDRQRFPEYPLFRQIIRLMAARAYVLSARGNDSEGVRSLLEALTFGRRISPANLLANLTAIVGEEGVYQGFADQLPKLSLKELTTIKEYVGTALSEPIPLVEVMRRAGLSQDRMIERELTTPRELADPASRMDPALLNSLRSIPDSEAAAFSAALRKAFAQTYGRIVGDLRKPEETWYEASAAWPTSDQRGRIGVSADIAEIAEALHLDLLPSYRRAVCEELRRRTQLRLLRLHAQVGIFLWRHHRLPTDLAEAVPGESLVDPLSGAPFMYERTGGNGFRLFSKGRPETGVVEMRYDRPPGQRGIEP